MKGYLDLTNAFSFFSSRGYLRNNDSESREHPTEEIDRDIDLEFPTLFEKTKERVKAYRFKGRKGVVYLDTQTHRFISKDGLMKIVSA
jgi:hypothetical protein